MTRTAMFSLPLALVVLISGIVALRRSDLALRVLAMHGQRDLLLMDLDSI